jgi:hypothetical protein
MYVNGSQLTHTVRSSELDTSIDYGDYPAAVTCKVSPGTSQAVDIRWYGSDTDQRTAHERTLVLLREAGVTDELIGAEYQINTYGISTY